jgi:hypothetical protein
MSRSLHRDDFFQTTLVRAKTFAVSIMCILSSSLTERCRTSLEENDRKAAKSRNTDGNPIKLQSKILAIAADPLDCGSVYVAESAGTIKKVVLEVGVQPC